mmetsp:Transcript_158313/g.507746  ORF Transcript_158313/g.507746 Transcript_158313/m.507746 type:complete len:94 (+) Transcript_158313:2-283(+)
MKVTLPVALKSSSVMMTPSDESGSFRSRRQFSLDIYEDNDAGGVGVDSSVSDASKENVTPSVFLFPPGLEPQQLLHQFAPALAEFGSASNLPR